MNSIRTLKESVRRMIRSLGTQAVARETRGHGARFSAEIHTRGCHRIPRMFA
jgi:hypothetical protein